jgi:RNA polymerase sigma factor (sigma-70 family)
LPENPPYTEQELLLRVAEGDEKAFHELVTSYAHLLYTFIFRIIGDRPPTEDLVQDVFVKIWLTREHLAEVRNFKAYLFIVSRNFAIKAAQKALREQKKLNEWKLQEAGSAEPQDHEWKFVLIEEAIASLPPQQHKVWTMSRRQCMKYTEIAEELGLSRDAVKKYLQYANASIMKYVKNRLDLLILVAIFLQG